MRGVLRTHRKGITRASAWALAIALASPALAQERAGSAQPDSTNPRDPRPQAPEVKVRTGIPKGFDDLGVEVRTMFDLTFQDRRVGSFAAILKDGTLTFENPGAIADALGEGVDTEAAKQFLSQPLLANEQFRCRPGQLPGGGCGVLPAGTAGVIVNGDTFGVTLFLSRDMLRSRVVEVRELAPPMSGPSLIQNIRFSAASIDGGDISYGGTLSTVASIGRTALVAQSTLSSYGGLRAEEGYVQHLWSERRAAAGLMQDYQTLTLNSYRMVGAELGSFYGTLVDPANDTATPIEVLLPRRAQVELYRFGVLVSSGLYDAGLQLIDTRALPDGTYDVRVVVRNGGQVLLDQIRPFSRVNSAVPPGKLGFRIRAGQRVRDTFLSSAFADADAGFLPRTTDELILSGSVQHRLNRAISGGLTATSFGSRVFGEATLEVNQGRIGGVAGVGGGSGGAYAIMVGGNLQFSLFSLNITARRMKAEDDLSGGFPALLRDRYQPFFRSQDSVFGSIQTVVLGGSLNLTGSYTRAPGLPTRYNTGLQYTRQMRIPLVGNALLTAGVARSDLDTRAGITFSFFRRIDAKTSGTFSAGGQQVWNTSREGGREGFSPVADASLTRTERLGSTDLIGELGAANDADFTLAVTRVRALSSLGNADAAAQWQSRAYGGSSWTYQANGETGFAIGGGAAKIGLRTPAQSMVLLDIARSGSIRSDAEVPEADGAAARTTGSTSGALVAEGGYRVMIDGRPADFIEPGSRVALGVQPLKEYRISLRPEGAPQFDLDATERTVVVYPGNVVRVGFEAQRIVSIFGRVVDAAGKGLAGGRVEAGTDLAIADDRGYFTVSAPLSSRLTIQTNAGEPCLQRPIASLVDADDPTLLHRLGQLTCGQ